MDAAVKTEIIRSKKLLAAAEGQACVNCGIRDDTVVSCHYEGIRAQTFGKGKGIKPHDLLTADLCYKCHLIFDGKEMSHFKDKYLRKIDSSEQFLFCVAMTLVRRVKQGVLKVDGDT